MANENPQRPNVEFYEDVKNLRKPLAGHDPLNLHLMAQSGDLYETLEGGKIHCYACGHHCKISPGGRGICQVRYNLNGTLYVPWGYVAALQCDPTEKKPFYHLYPGSDTLTFGMLGCDLHCSYCFTGDTPVVTNRGVMRFDELFDSAKRVDLRPDGEIASIDGLQAVAESGQWQNVRAIFKHPYQGQLAVIKPYYLPEIKCTADHQLYATDSATVRPQPIMAKELTSKHYLAIPKNYSFSKPQIIDVQKEIGSHQITYQVTWDIPTTDIQFILDATAQGMSSKQIGQVLGKNPSYIRHIRSKIGRGRYNLERTQGAIIENNLLRFPNERRPGIPTQIPLDENLARLLGYYCAEGSVITGKERPNSHSICFAFALDEIELANEVKNLILTCFGIEAAIVTRETTLAVQFSKSSIALLLKKLVGGSAVEKHIPEPLFDAPRPIVEAFIDAYAAGDGHLYENGKYSITTVSKQLAYDIAWLTLKLGNPPSLYVKEMPSKGLIVGREVNFSPYQFTVVWYKDSKIARKIKEIDNFYLIPLRNIKLVDYDGDVFNMEVEVEHNYLAGFFLVKNCQNWDISQALRDTNAGRPPTQVSPQQMVQMAKLNGAKCVASSYNEPLITSEWAVSIFKEAKAAGFTCMYISNGNATREVLEYIRPYTDGYKIDLKTMNPKNYRQLGAVLENVLDGIRMAHELGFWVEIVTLVIPGFNDSVEELKEAAQFIRSLSPDIPWHVTAFHKDYKMTDPDNTDTQTLIRAAEIGYEMGLNYVYAGNQPGRVEEYEHTFCPHCKKKLIDRIGYVIRDYQITPEGRCPRCNTPIAGVWPKDKSEVRLGSLQDLYFRRPHPVRWPR